MKKNKLSKLSPLNVIYFYHLLSGTDPRILIGGGKITYYYKY